MPSRRTAWLLVAFAFAAVAFVAPRGTYKPYSRRLLPESAFALPCTALPTTAFESVGATVSSRNVLLDKPLIEVENLFPSVSRTACIYQWSARCSNAAQLKSASLTATTLPTDRQALYRYSYNQLLLRQDSKGPNAFANYRVDGSRAYRLTIGNEVLIRILSGRVILDLHAHLCGTITGRRAEALVGGIVDKMRLPVEVNSRRPRTYMSTEPL